MRIYFVYPAPMTGELRRIEAGEAPTDRMYGLVELRQAGHEVDYSDRRFEGRFDSMRRALRPFANLPGVDDLAALGRYDIVVAKDEFSTSLTAACRARGTKIVYMDALFDLPRRWWKRAAARANFAMADGHIAYSQEQIDLWKSRYHVPDDRFTFLPYCIDTAFLRRKPRQASARPYVLAVGRDMGRNFDTLVHAMDGLGLDLKLVTLPYLLRTIDASQPWIEVHQHISYDALLQLYADALLVAIPLKRDVTYPSGIRGLLEALTLGKSVVSTRTGVLEEYVKEGEGVLYVEADNAPSMRAAIDRIRDDQGLRQQLENAGPAVVKARYDMSRFAELLDAYLRRIVEG